MPDHASPSITRLAAMHTTGPVGALGLHRPQSRGRHSAGSNGLLDRRIDGMKLMIARDDFMQFTRVGVLFKHHEMLQQIK